MLATKIVSEDGISYNLTPLGYVVLIAVVIVMLAVGFIVKDKKTEQMRPAEFRDIVILTRSMKGYADVYMEVLKKEGTDIDE